MWRGWQRAPGLDGAGAHADQDLDPSLGVGPLQPTDLLARLAGHVLELTFMPGDKGGLVEGQPDVPVQPRIQRRLRSSRAGYPVAPLRQ
jgi:hypothetical protein